VSREALLLLALIFVPGVVVVLAVILRGYDVHLLLKRRGRHR
jgi:hypothetical protein